MHKIMGEKLVMLEWIIQCILDYLYLDYLNLDYPNTKLAAEEQESGRKQSTIQSFFSEDMN